MRWKLLILMPLAMLMLLQELDSQQPEPAPEPKPLTGSLSILDLVPDLDTKTDVTAVVKKALASDAAKGRAVFFPAGRYLFSGNILTLSADENQGIVGEGIDRTVFHFYGEPNQPLIVTNGEELTKAPFHHQAWFTFDALTVNTADTVEVPIIRHRFTGHAYYNRVLFRGAKYGAVEGYSWWDTTFTECHWTNCGDLTTSMAAVHLMDSKLSTSADRCNNIVLDNCRFEACHGVAIYLGRYTTRCRLRSCKFDRVMLGIQFNEANCCTVSDSQMIGHADNRGIEAVKSRAIVITSTHFDRLLSALDLKQTSGIINDCTFGQATANTRNGTDLALDAASIKTMKTGVNLWSVEPKH